MSLEPFEPTRVENKPHIYFQGGYWRVTSPAPRWGSMPHPVRVNVNKAYNFIHWKNAAERSINR